MSYEGLQFEVRQETFNTKEGRDSFALSENRVEFGKTRIVAGEKINRILDKFTDPEIEDPKKSRKEFVKMTSGLFIIPTVLGLLGGNFLGGLIVGIIITGVYLFTLYKLKN